MSIVLPWNIAFEGDELLEPLYFDLVVNSVFLLDIIVNFNTAVYQEKEMKTVLVYDRKEIAKAYLKGWFVLDTISCIPFDYITDYGMNELFKMARVSKLQKLLRLFKVPRILKICTMRSRMQSSFASFYQGAVTNDSVVFILVLLGLFCHFSACLWVFVTFATLDQ